MTLNPAQINKVSIILGTGKRFVNAQIASLGTDFSAQDETDIIAEIARWAASGGKFTNIRPNLANKGAEVIPEKVKADIRKNIAVYLGLDYVLQSGSVGTIEIGL